MRSFAVLLVAKDLLRAQPVCSARQDCNPLALFSDALERYRPEPFFVGLDGEEDEEVKHLLSHKRLTFLQPEAHRSQPKTREDWLRLAQGRMATAGGFPRGLLYVDCSHPYLQVQTLLALAERALERPEESVWPLNQGREGQLCYLAPDLLSALEKPGAKLEDLRVSGLYPGSFLFTGDSGLWQTVREAPAGGEEAGQQVCLQRLRPRFVLACQGNYYGPGPHMLLKLVRQGLSLRAACREMNLSYTKGRYMVAGIEKNLGRPILISYQGGREGGKSELTACGLALLDTYEAFLQEAEEGCQVLFQQYFEDFFLRFPPEGLTEEG